MGDLDGEGPVSRVIVSPSTSIAVRASFTGPARSVVRGLGAGCFGGNGVTDRFSYWDYVVVEETIWLSCLSEFID